MTDIEPYNDETKAWADLVLKTARQRGLVKKAGTWDAERSLLSHQIADACSVDVDLAYSWISGYDLPRSADYNNTVLKVLELNPYDHDTFVALPKGPARNLMYRSGEITQAWGNAYDTIKDVPERRVEGVVPQGRTAGGGRRATGSSGGGNKNVNHDSEGMPPRHYQGNALYKDLDKRELLDIQSNTDSFPEFLRVSRYLKDWTLEKLAQKVGKRDDNIDIDNFKMFIRIYEIGRGDFVTMFPTSDRLYLLLETLFDKKTELYNRGEELLIRNRAKLMDFAQENGDVNSYGQRISGMPQCYFKRRMQKTNELYNFEKSSNDSPPPAWDDVAPEIASRSRYYFATRHLMVLSTGDVAQALGVSSGNISNIETGDASDYTAYKNTDILERLSEYYQKEQEAALRDGRLSEPVFSPQVAEALPVDTSSRAQQLEARRGRDSGTSR